MSITNRRGTRSLGSLRTGSLFLAPHRFFRQVGLFFASFQHLESVVPEEGMPVKSTQPRSRWTKPDRLRTRVNLALLGVFLLFVVLWALLIRLSSRHDITLLALGLTAALGIALLLAV